MTWPVGVLNGSPSAVSMYRFSSRIRIDSSVQSLRSAISPAGIHCPDARIASVL